MSADPNVTSVGGSQFHPVYDGAGNDVGSVAESAWNDPAGAGGGGKSQLFSKPSYQNSVTPNDGGRDVPDVAYAASPYFPGFYWGDDVSGTAVMNCCIGGTSLAAPLWAGLAKLIAQKSGRLGNMNPKIYQLGALNNAAQSGLRDVTSGNNNWNGVAGFPAVTGYDQATGWGTADMATFASAFAGASSGSTPTPTPTATPTPTSTPTSTPTPTVTPTAKPTPTPQPTPTPTPKPRHTPKPTPTPTPKAPATPTPTPTSTTPETSPPLSAVDAVLTGYAGDDRREWFCYLRAVGSEPVHGPYGMGRQIAWRQRQWRSVEPRSRAWGRRMIPLSAYCSKLYSVCERRVLGMLPERF
jgi:hypothetical protein